jgi:serine/threonine protein phosphatase PrpC
VAPALAYPHRPRAREALASNRRRDLAAAVHPGLVRAENEDAAHVCPAIGLALVADGLGGHPRGEVASRTAVETAIRSFTRRGGAAHRAVTTARRLRSALEEANAEVRAQPGILGEPPMGTTLVALAVGDTYVAVAHVGDSRCYRVRNGALERLTRDHTLAERSAIADAAGDRDSRLLTACIGGGGRFTFDLVTHAAQPGDVYLLCSHGLWETVSERKLARITRRAERAIDTCRRLLSAACAAGGHDNVAVAVVRLGGGSAASTAFEHPT